MTLRRDTPFRALRVVVLFARDRRAVTPLEYAAIAALMMMVLATVMASEASAYESTFLRLANILQSADSGSGPGGAGQSSAPCPPMPGAQRPR